MASVSGKATAVLVTVSRTMATTNVTRWLGKIFSRRRRQNPRTVSAGRTDQVRTKPLSMKKKETPTAPALPNQR